MKQKPKDFKGKQTSIQNGLNMKKSKVLRIILYKFFYYIRHYLILED